jgi:hypothetical protein
VGEEKPQKSLTQRAQRRDEEAGLKDQPYMEEFGEKETARPVIRTGRCILKIENC